MKMPDPRDRIVRALVYLVLAAFSLGVVVAGWLTLVATSPGPQAMPPFVTKALTAVNGTLSLNLGAYLGIRSVQATWDGEPNGYLQKVSCWVYVGDFALALAFWGLAGFHEEATRVVPLLPTIATAGIGVVLAVFGTALGKRP